MNVDFVALIAWLIAAVGGLYLLITWLVCGGIRQQRPRATSFPALLIFAHFLLAAASRKCAKISSAGKLVALGRCCRIPPQTSQVMSRYKPPTAAMSQAIKATKSTFMSYLLTCSEAKERRGAPVPG